MPRAMTAQFPTGNRAITFHGVLAAADPRAWKVQRGSLDLDLTGDRASVTWRTDGTEENDPGGFAAYLVGMSQTVGYYGSSHGGGVATLNGRPCPGGF